jgi:hypothetical protein
MGLIASRDTQERAGQVIDFPVAAATKLYVGALVALSSTGYLVPASDTAGLKVQGRCEGTPPPGITGQDVDNSAGANGDLTANVKRGVFKYDNSTGDAVTADMAGKSCYVEDDHTVNKSGGTNKIRAGRVVGIDSDGGVWIDTTAKGLHASVTLTQTSSATIAGLHSTAVNPTKADFDALLAEAGKLQADFYALVADLS